MVPVRHGIDEPRLFAFSFTTQSAHDVTAQHFGLGGGNDALATMFLHCCLIS